MQQKWIDKLLEYKDENVDAGLAEAIPFINEDLKKPLFKKLVNTKDRVTKEFLAENITSIPGYKQDIDMIKELLNGADNMIRGSLANTIKKMPTGMTKSTWTKMVLDGADNSIKAALLGE